MKWILPVLTALSCAPTFAATTADGAQGKKLHDANCMSCHDAGVYTRKDRRVGSLDALRRQVDACSHMAHKNFSDTERRHLVTYLNEQFYKFK